MSGSAVGVVVDQVYVRYIYIPTVHSKVSVEELTEPKLAKNPATGQMKSTLSGEEVVVEIYMSPGVEVCQVEASGVAHLDSRLGKGYPIRAYYCSIIIWGNYYLRWKLPCKYWHAS